jgi:hypothetical protein
LYKNEAQVGGQKVGEIGGDVSLVTDHMIVDLTLIAQTHSDRRVGEQQLNQHVKTTISAWNAFLQALGQAAPIDKTACVLAGSSINNIPCNL